MSKGSISLLVDSPLRTVLVALRGVPPEVRKQVNQHTRAAAKPIWREELQERVVTRLQRRALLESAAVGVSTRNVVLRSGGVGTLSSGTPVSAVSMGAEFGANADTPVTQKSRAGKRYTRRMGNAFGPRVRGGNAVYKAGIESVPRFASLLVQTATRTVLDAFDKGGQ